MLLKDLSKKEQEVANQLTRSGYLVTELSEVVQGPFVVAFVSKLVYGVHQILFHNQNYSTLAQMPTSMSDFLRLVLQRMSFAQMVNS